jgi:hypothetical protein
MEELDLASHRGSGPKTGVSEDVRGTTVHACHSRNLVPALRCADGSRHGPWAPVGGPLPLRRHAPGRSRRTPSGQRAPGQPRVGRTQCSQEVRRGNDIGQTPRPAWPNSRTLAWLRRFSSYGWEAAQGGGPGRHGASPCTSCAVAGCSLAVHAPAARPDRVASTSPLRPRLALIRFRLPMLSGRPESRMRCGITRLASPFVVCRPGGLSGLSRRRSRVRVPSLALTPGPSLGP